MSSGRSNPEDKESPERSQSSTYSFLGGLLSNLIQSQTETDPDYNDDDDDNTQHLEDIALNEAAESLVSSAEVQQALADANHASPRVITITNLPRPKLNFCVLGCHGSPGQGPKDVAAEIDRIVAAHPELKIDFFVILGDNFYPDGVFNPVDPRFETQFHQIFGNEKLKNIANTPCIIVLGNHDGGHSTETHLKSYVPYNNVILGTNPHHGQEAEKQQVAHSMMRHPSDSPALKETKAALFQRDAIDYQLLPQHIMPYYFHSWVIGNVQLFGLNSNTYAKDYLQHLYNLTHDQPNKGPVNQAEWFEREALTAKIHGRSIMIAQHHPLFTTGKRLYPSGWDAKHYLTPREITMLEKILKLSPTAPDFLEKVRNIFRDTPEKSHSFSKNANYNKMLTTIMCEFQKITPHMITTAHDHSLYYYNNKPSDKPEPKLCEVVSGAGGNDELQPRLFFGDKHLASFTREYGFAIVSTDTMNATNYDIHLFTNRGFHLQYTSDSPEPKRDKNPDERIEIIRKLVLTACEQYQQFLHLKQEASGGAFFNAVPNITSYARLFQYNSVHTLHDVDLMHTMMNFLNQNVTLTYQDTIIFLNQLMEELDNKESEHSLYVDINNLLSVKFGKTINLMYTELQYSQNPIKCSE